MAGVEGLEPSQAVLETDVLPLTLYPYILSQNNLLIYYTIFIKNMQVYFEKNSNKEKREKVSKSPVPSDTFSLFQV